MKKTIIGLIAIAAIVAVVIFAGCVEKDAPEFIPGFITSNKRGDKKC